MASEPTVKQISDLVHVDFEVRHLDVKLQVLLHGVDVIEDVVDDTRDDSLLARVTDDTLHCVRLPRRRLPVGEYRPVVPAEHICNRQRVGYKHT